MQIRVQQEDFAPAALIEGFDLGAGDIGAVVSFTGVVRGDGGLRYMEIEHYPAMTAPAIRKIADQARQRWDLSDLLVVHRYGRLQPGDRIMMVATAAPHRRAAFEAADFLMDYLKSRAPFWKKEVSDQGASWVEAKPEDEADLTRWG